MNRLNKIVELFKEVTYQDAGICLYKKGWPVNQNIDDIITVNEIIDSLIRFCRENYHPKHSKNKILYLRSCTKDSSQSENKYCRACVLKYANCYSSLIKFTEKVYKDCLIKTSNHEPIYKTNSEGKDSEEIRMIESLDIIYVNVCRIVFYEWFRI